MKINAFSVITDQIQTNTDECATEEHSCSADAVCNNAEGSYNCSCKPGYSGDGWSCKGSKMKQCILNLGPHKLWYSVLSIQC